MMVSANITETLRAANSLTDGVITLNPSCDIDYFYSVVRKYKYNTCDSKEKLSEIVSKYCRFMWEGSSNGVTIGVVFLMYFADAGRWTLDAYADMDAIKEANPKGDFSYRAGKLAIEFFFDTNKEKQLYTCHDIRSRAATVMCARLGFKITETITIVPLGEFVTMALQKESWENGGQHGR